MFLKKSLAAMISHVAVNQEGKTFDVCNINLEMNYVKYYNYKGSFEIANIICSYIDKEEDIVYYRVK